MEEAKLWIEHCIEEEVAPTTELEESLRNGVYLAKVFTPETTDVYDRKNMPRVVFCLHALSLFLYKARIFAC